jgi:hypothetical protein
MRAVVTGMIATYPVGGVAWDYGQYALGLEQLGFEVYYLEDTGLPSYTYNPSIGGYEEDCSHGVDFLEQSLALLSPTLAKRWHFRSVDDRTYGLDAAEIADVVANADLFLNVSGGCLLRDEYRSCVRKVFVDTDPGWNQFVVFPQWDRRPEEQRRQGFRGHDYFFTYAQRLGQIDCPLPLFGLKWHPTRPPVVLNCWSPQPPAKQWTTVMTWDNYQHPVEYDGARYGSKEGEFPRVAELPSRSSASFEVAVNAVDDDIPREQWRDLGWSVANGRAKSVTAEAYRSYVASSRGEFSVAKNIYVATRSGWFSCRSVCYMAASRPVVIQDTGFSDVVPTGDGLLRFSNIDEAAKAIALVERDYGHHQDAARELVSTHFDSCSVLSELLDRVRLE